MEPVTILIVSLIVVAFAVFAGVLAYGEHVTRRAREARERTSPSATAPKPSVDASLRKVA
jgi:hypothetical protein